MTGTLPRAAMLIAALALLGAGVTQSPQTPSKQFGGAYADLGARRQKLVGDWVARLNGITGVKLEPQPFYDEKVKLSSKTTFDAVTNALMTTPLTDPSGEKLGDALDLVERVESVRGQVLNAGGDHQFRMYVRLTGDAIDRLERSREFERGADNTVYHKGYPINYRQQGGSPSIQISISLDRRQADLDVDYRSSSFPAGLFNGHLTAANSDVRAGDNYDRHTNRWSGFENWWRNLFGVRVGSSTDQPPDKPGLIPATPRAGDKNVPVMMEDFLRAWLIEGDVLNAMSYFSERSYACLAQDGEDFASFDRGMAPIHLLLQLKAAHDALGKRPSLEGLVVGVRLAKPELKVVTQPHHAQFVVYSVPDDVAQAFDCESRLTLADTTRARRVYGRYFGATFYVDGRQDRSMALLWARESGYWKIVSWQSEPEGDDVAEKLPAGSGAAETPRATLKADATLVDAASDFLQAWLLRKDYDAAFKYFSPGSYSCYNLARGQDQTSAVSPEEAARRIRDALERSGKDVGKQTRLDTLLLAVTPFHAAIRVLSHPHSRTFALTNIPDAIARTVNCDARARGERFSGEIPPEFGGGFHGMNFRFQTRGGETPVVRLLWAKEKGAWRITAYDVEYP